MTDRELMQQALYALEYASDMTKPENMSGCGCPICVTITALRDRLAQPEQEPVAFVKENPFCPEGHSDELSVYLPVGIKLYTIPPQRPWVGLTEREVELIDGMIEVELQHAERCDRIANRNMAEKQKGWDMERVALLRKIKEKNK